MASAISNSGFSQDPRNGRMTAMHQASSTKSPTKFGLPLGSTQNTWNGAASIWADGARTSLFTDRGIDDENADVLNNRLGKRNDYDSPAGSLKPLVSPSGSGGWNGRPSVPWSTTGLSNTTMPALKDVSAYQGRRDLSSTTTPSFQSGETANTSYFGPKLSDQYHSSSASRESTTQLRRGSRKAATPPSYTFGSMNTVARGADFENPSAHKYLDYDSTTAQSRSALLRAGSESYAPRAGYQKTNGASATTQRNADFIDNTQARSSGPPATHRSLQSKFQPMHQYTNSSHPTCYVNKETFSQYDGVEDQSTEPFGRLGVQSQLPNQDYAALQRKHPDQRPLQQSEYPFDSRTSIPKYNSISDGATLLHPSQHSAELIYESVYNIPPGYFRSLSFDERGSPSPATSDRHQSLNSPFYSTTATPPTGPGSMRSGSGDANANFETKGYLSVLDHKLRGPYQLEEQYSTPNPLRSRHPFSQPFEFDGYVTSLGLNPLANAYTAPLYGGAAPASFRYPSRELDPSQIIRSPILEDFRTNHKTNKRYELKDIYSHVVEFSGDQHGSRFIQQKLETANSDEKDQIFAEIQPNSLQLMTDVFGNYVIQKLFEHGNQAQKKVLANQMKGHVLPLSTQMYGCRVVQKALEYILTDQQASMVKELENHVLKCVKDQNGNHVIQKAIERVPAEHIQFIINAFTDQVQRLATHPYGCRVIQRMLEHCQEPAKQSVLRELHACVTTLITDQFGNYVIQHVIENGDAGDKQRIVAIVTSQLLTFSKHKFASNVVEKSIEFAEESQRVEILRQLTTPNEKGESPVLSLMRDQYGNYVIQKVLGQLKGIEREALVTQIKPQLIQLKKFSYGKQIIAIEKLIFEPELDANLSASSQSSTLPSTNASTVEGPITQPHVHVTKPSFPADLTAIFTPPAP